MTPPTASMNTYITASAKKEKTQQVVSQTRSIMKTVMERCKKEKDSNQLQVPLEDYMERVSFYTGFPKTYLYKLNEDVDKETNVCTMTIDPILILKHMKDFYLKSMRPTLKNVHSVASSTDNHFPPYTMFKYEMAKLGYSYKLSCKGCILVEDPKVTFERFYYIKNIKRHRARRSNIYYIEERVVDLKLKLKKFDIHADSDRKMVLFHMISKIGYENGLYCQNVTEDEFLKWFLDMVLPSLKPSSVIVMDNSPLHGMLANNSISRYHSKSDMLKWLRNNNIPCTNKFHKAELYELIDKSGRNKDQYIIDEILKAHGHVVLRIPVHYDNLSPTGHLWPYLKSELSEKLPTTISKSSVGVLKNLVNEHITSIPLHKWIEFENIVENKEDEILAIDVTTEQALDNYKLHATKNFDDAENDIFVDSDNE